MTGVPVGALRRRMMLETATRTPDGGGGAALTWAAVASVWAAVLPAAGREAMTAGRISGRVSHVVWLRYRADIGPAMRLRAGSRVLEILAVIDAGDRRTWLRCLCEEREL